MLPLETSLAPKLTPEPEAWKVLAVDVRPAVASLPAPEAPADDAVLPLTADMAGAEAACALLPERTEPEAAASCLPPETVPERTPVFLLP